MQFINQTTNKKDNAIFDYRTNTWHIGPIDPYFSIIERDDKTVLYVYQPEVDVNDFKQIELSLESAHEDDQIVIFTFNGTGLNVIPLLKMLGFDVPKPVTEAPESVVEGV